MKQSWKEMESAKPKVPLHSFKFVRRKGFNRAFALVYALAIFALFYNHIQKLLKSNSFTSFFISFSMFIADVILAFMWSTTQSFRMSPVVREVYPENLEKVFERKDFPCLDIFICTADPYKEPPLNVVNTALSVMAYDYPTEKISVYVSDDGGSQLTLFAFMEAANFGKHWLPFCRQNNIVDRSPDAYFRSNYSTSSEHDKIKLRVSATMTNAPIVLTLDCDMFSNDPLTPHRVLCFLKEESASPRLAYIQFPQRFHGLNKADIYASEIKRLFTVNPMGMDGLKGPNYVGSGCFFRRRVFFGGPSSPIQPQIPELNPDHVVKKAINSEEILNLAHHVSACNYEDLSDWGSKLGFRYGSLVEDYYTGYRLKCEGWESLFCNPHRPAFLGDVPISLTDVLAQNKRWSVGLLEVGFCKYSPMTFGLKTMGPLMALAYAHYAFWPIWSISMTIYACLPQLTLLNKTSIFPKVGDAQFLLYVFLFLGAYGQDCTDFVLTQGTFRRWWSDQRMWLIRGLSSFMFGTMEYLIKHLGISTQGFNLTSKVVDDEQGKRYDQGKLEFGLESPMFVPLAVAAILNLIAFLVGLLEVLRGNWNELFLQMFIAGFGILNSLPFYEAMILRADKGRMPTKTTIISTLLVGGIYAASISLLKI